MPKEKKDQFVIAYITDFERCGAMLSYAQEIARILNKGLILLYICDSRYTKQTTAESSVKIENLKRGILINDVTHCVLQGKTKTIIDNLPTMLNGVIAITQVNRSSPIKNPSNPIQVLHNFRDSKIAYLTVQHPDIAPTQTPPLQHIALRIDYRKESKEKLIWSSYFARFNKSQLHILHEEYKDSGLREKFLNNMRFLDRFYKSLNVTYQTEPMNSAANFQEIQATKHIAQKHYDLQISVTTDTRERDFFDWFFGTEETRVIKNKEQVPVLFINPRDDIYVLCD